MVINKRKLISIDYETDKLILEKTPVEKNGYNNKLKWLLQQVIIQPTEPKPEFKPAIVPELVSNPCKIEPEQNVNVESIPEREQKQDVPEDTGLAQ